MPKHIIDTGTQSFANDVEVLGALTAPNQSLSTGSSVLTRSIGEERFSIRGKVIKDDSTISKTVFEQFVDFDKENPDSELILANAIGTSNFSSSPFVFGDIWNRAGLIDQDLHTHHGIYLLRGHTSNNAALYIGLRRTTRPQSLSNSQLEFTTRVFIPNTTEFQQQGFIRFGPIQKGGTGGADTSLRSGLMFNPYVHPTNFVLANNFTATTPYLLRSTGIEDNIAFIDTGINFIDLLGKWVNISYISKAYTSVQIIIKRDTVVLHDLTFTSADMIPNLNVNNLTLIGASGEIGLTYGKFTHTTRQEIYFDYIHTRYTGNYSGPSNWNSLRF